MSFNHDQDLSSSGWLQKKRKSTKGVVSFCFTVTQFVAETHCSPPKKKRKTAPGNTKQLRGAPNSTSPSVEQPQGKEQTTSSKIKKKLAAILQEAQDHCVASIPASLYAKMASLQTVAGAEALARYIVDIAGQALVVPQSHASVHFTAADYLLLTELGRICYKSSIIFCQFLQVRYGPTDS